jgi:hypothetical protein
MLIRLLHRKWACLPFNRSSALSLRFHRALGTENSSEGDEGDWAKHGWVFNNDEGSWWRTKGKGWESWSDGADSTLNNTIYHLGNCETTATAVAEVLSTHGANLRGEEFTHIIRDFGRRKEHKRIMCVNYSPLRLA